MTNIKTSDVASSACAAGERDTQQNHSVSTLHNTITTAGTNTTDGGRRGGGAWKLAMFLVFFFLIFITNVVSCTSVKLMNL